MGKANLRPAPSLFERRCYILLEFVFSFSGGAWGQERVSPKNLQDMVIETTSHKQCVATSSAVLSFWRSVPTIDSNQKSLGNQFQKRKQHVSNMRSIRKLPLGRKTLHINMDLSLVM